MSQFKKSRFMSLCVAGAAALGAAWFVNGQDARAADHNDPPARVGNAVDAADIADLYAWHSDDDGTLTIAMTFAGPTMPADDQTGTYDADVLYGIHIDNSGDNTANSDIWVRFAQNDLGDWGVQLLGVPGEAGPVVGPVETEIDADNGAKVFTGLRDDPFFFDLEGFQNTVMTGDLSFMSSRDSFAGQNVTTVVLEVPLAAALGGGTDLSIWATSSRI